MRRTTLTKNSIYFDYKLALRIFLDGFKIIHFLKLNNYIDDQGQRQVCTFKNITGNLI